MQGGQGFFTTLSHVFDFLYEESDEHVHTAFVILVCLSPWSGNLISYIMQYDSVDCYGLPCDGDSSTMKPHTFWLIVLKVVLSAATDYFVACALKGQGSVDCLCRDSANHVMLSLDSLDTV